MKVGKRKNPGASDLITLAILGIGAAAVLKSSGSSATSNSGSDAAGTRDATSDEMAKLVAAGQVQPTDVVKVVTEQTKSGQTVSYATVNYDPGNTQRSQVVISSDNVARIQGYYIPQLDEDRMKSLALQYSGHGSDWKTWLAEVATWADNGGPWDYTTNQPLVKLSVQDWDYFRRMAFPGDAPFPADQAGASGALSPEEYKNLLLSSPGGYLSGREVHYKGMSSLPARAMRGLGRTTSPHSWMTL